MEDDDASQNEATPDGASASASPNGVRRSNVLSLASAAKRKDSNPKDPGPKDIGSETPRSFSSDPAGQNPFRVVSFDRIELRLILNLYGRQVAAGEWRDYAIDFERDKATFSIMRRTNEYPVYRIQKTPELARKQGTFSVVSVTGFILKRGHDLRQVLKVLEPPARLHQA